MNIIKLLLLDTNWGWFTIGIISAIIFFFLFYLLIRFKFINISKEAEWIK